MKKKLIDRFIKYAMIDTQSDPDSYSFPSTEKQFNLARVLVKELEAFGLKNVSLDNFCYVMATLPANCADEIPKIGLIAHLDTSSALSSENVKPKIIENYPGGDYSINESLGVILSESECPDLKKCIGQTLITSDGTTLLGADDKAGVTAIMALMELLTNNPQIKHGEIRVAFTPDEEIGRGADHFDLEKFNADFAYTVDGGYTGELNRETFSADEALIEIQGRDIHPGTAKGIMVNSIKVMAEIIRRLPENMTPENTEDYQPFMHPVNAEGGVSLSTIRLILRDFSAQCLSIQKQILEDIIREVENLFLKATIKLTVTETYRNMAEILSNNTIVTDRLWNAALKAGAKPFWKPVRGGTDGSRLTSMGLPTPNIFTGSGNHHSKTEWLSVEALEMVVETLCNLVRIE